MAWTVIDHDTLGVAAASWTSTTIPADYDHLCLMVSGRSAQSAVYSAQMIRFNGDTTAASYSSQNLFGWSTSSVSGENQTTATGVAYPMLTGTTTASQTFGAITAWIPDYKSTAGFKAAIVQSTAPYATTGQGQVRYTAGLWQDTSAITSITVIGLTGNNFDQHSSFTLYGITGA